MPRFLPDVPGRTGARRALSLDVEPLPCPCCRAEALVEEIDATVSRPVLGARPDGDTELGPARVELIATSLRWRCERCRARFASPAALRPPR